MAAAIIALSQNITDFLLDGYNVSINGIGTFSLSTESKVADKETEIRARSVTKNINFRSSAALKKAMTKAKFVRVQN